MKTDIHQIEKLLIQVHNMSAYYEKFAEQTGENFNIFETLGLASSEVRLHSKILAEFLNPRGTHGQKDVYLRLFLDEFKIADFDTNSANAEVEKYIGVIDEDYSKGGRIDILITDKNNNHIIIENKIYAIDQTNQLLRYYNFDRKAKIFYLSLYDNQSPDPSSLGGVLAIEKIKIISYRTHIIQWLEECKKVSTSLPIIRETIAQYINLLKILTNQTTYNKMNDEIIELIKENPNYADSIVKCNSALDYLIKEVYKKFTDELDLAFSKKIPIAKDGKYEIVSGWGEDVDGVCFGFELYENGKNVGQSIDAQKYKDIFSRIEGLLQSNGYWVYWYNPAPIKRNETFLKFDKKFIVELSDDTVLKNFIGKLIEVHDEISKKFLAELEKENNIILEFGGEGGSIKLIKIEKDYYFSTDESAFMDLLPSEFEKDELVSTSGPFDQFEAAFAALMKRYNVFKLYPLSVNQNYASEISIYLMEYISTEKYPENNFNIDEWKKLLKVK